MDGTTQLEVGVLIITCTLFVSGVAGGASAAASAAAPGVLIPPSSPGRRARLHAASGKTVRVSLKEALRDATLAVLPAVAA